MGEVYRARDTRLDRSVAIKILPSHLSVDPARKQRFEREAKAISGLNHPNICTLHDVGSLGDLDYIVMECIEGESLAERLTRGALPSEQVLKIGAELADALDKAHRNGVVHRDLKPANIMLTKSGAKLLDFGLAKPTVPQATLATLTSAAPKHSPVTQEGTIVGTFQYMSPEQIEGKELDGRSDIFSLGTVLYEMLTGQRAFEGKSQLSVASAILEKEPAPITSVNPLTPLSRPRDPPLPGQGSRGPLANRARSRSRTEMARHSHRQYGFGPSCRGSSSQQIQKICPLPNRGTGHPRCRFLLRSATVPAGFFRSRHRAREHSAPRQDPVRVH